MRVNGEVQSPNHIHAAKGFLRNIGAGEAFNLGVIKTIAIRGIEEPGIAELANRALADVDAEDFELMLAEIYARHLSYSQLVELEKLSANKGVEHYFELVYQAAFAGKPADDQTLMRQLNADELTQVMILAQSDAFTALSMVQPDIDREIDEAAGAWGEMTMRRYIDEQRARVLKEMPSDIQSRKNIPATPALSL
tara:strand:+ start:44205 stop:44789 length:585 start_codon:yes stop_codon:yes gene_type:complete